MGLLPDLGEEEQCIEELIRMGSTYEQDRSFGGDVECAAGSDSNQRLPIC